MNAKTRQEVAVEAVQWLQKTDRYGITGVKIELEAQLNRNMSRAGTINCSECEGYGTDQNICPNECDGEEYYSELDDEYVTCDDHERCDACDGTGSIARPGERRDMSRLETCHDFILEKLLPLGLAEERRADLAPRGANLGRLQPKLPLVYSKFYHDGSVDSEITMTIALDNPENILFLPKIIEAFSDLAEACGGADTRGAGMHMALMNSPGATYPVTVSHDEYQRFVNFQRSMTMLLPALYFLASPDDVSRRLGYRQPGIGCDNSDYNSSHGKYSAISFRGGALEFRLFETCYKYPEVILDNFVVMRNTMRYWTDEFVRPKIADKISMVDFGNDNNNKLERLYVKSEHFDLLNAGLQILKPSYQTIKEVKLQRGFKKTKNHVRQFATGVKKQASKEYNEYRERFMWAREIDRHQEMLRIARELRDSGQYRSTPREELLEQIGRRAEESMRSVNPMPLETFTEDKVRQATRNLRGSYNLSV